MPCSRVPISFEPGLTPCQNVDWPSSVVDSLATIGASSVRAFSWLEVTETTELIEIRSCWPPTSPGYCRRVAPNWARPSPPSTDSSSGSPTIAPWLSPVESTRGSPASTAPAPAPKCSTRA
ncbi:hypothetical protein ACFFX0_19165 [Citricoccus parietis]|uniref:Uncharacterized protein n=1 Tax=Citricoccus parietis TaxID=592307 RepID=A0ABV5G2N8_9MICC